MRDAVWMLRDPDARCFEDYLCNDHWEIVNAKDHLRAFRYAHLSSIFTEGVALVSCSQFATAVHDPVQRSVPVLH